LRVVWRDLIAGQLFQNHLMEGFVLIEGSNNVVPKRPGIVSQQVLLVSGALAETNHVKPVASPSFSVVRGIQQAINEPFVGIRSVIFNESLHLLRSRRKTQKIEGCAADVNPAVRRRRRRKALLPKFGINEAVNRGCSPLAGKAHRVWKRIVTQRLERPP